MHAVYILPVFFVFKIPWTVSTSVHINVYHFSSCIRFDCIGIFIYLSDDNWVMSNFCYYIQCWNELHYACVKSLCTYRTVSVEQIPTSGIALSKKICILLCWHILPNCSSEWPYQWHSYWHYTHCVFIHSPILVIIIFQFLLIF